MRGIYIAHILLLVASVLLFSCINRSAVKSYHKNKTEAPYDAIIVPGVPFEGKTWQDVMKMRVYWSVYLYENGYTKNIIYSGSAVYSPYVESIIMKQYGIALGIPEEYIYTDTLAEHSTENVYYSYHQAKKMGFEKIALATDPFQSAMVKKFVKKHKLDIAYLPVVFDTLKEIEQINPPIDPAPAFIKNFISLPDREGFWKRFRGTLGKNVKEVEVGK
ncbi:YdcF family protein [Flammeovirgaceae bacterium SG7u.111]|nr:YdcF family protein [Flammeovirgaceae bacterium SG7u.132]WPO36543.1 YdcF family protein [Flammeovirgaceae bacterium SG7u.111]